MGTMRRLPVLVAIIASALICGELAQAQTAIPQRFSYQGIARDQSGLPLSNSTVAVRISILEGSALGNAVYIETHSTSTNEFGLFTLQIGGGSPFLGTFSEVRWGSSLKWMRVEIDLEGEGTYSPIGTSQLLSVPYAIAAGIPKDMDLNDLTDVEIDRPSIGNSLRWNGTAWTAGSAAATVDVSSRLSGDGSGSEPLDIARQGATFGQVLKWNGTSWEPSDDIGSSLTAGPGIDIINNAITHSLHTGDVSGSTDLTVTGIQGRPVINLSPVSGQVLKYDDGVGGWIPSTDNSLSLIAGNGLEITNRTIKGTQWTDASTNIYRATGSIGIGTSAPLQQLHVTQNFHLGGALMPNGKAGTAGQILTSDGSNKPAVWKNATDIFGNIGWSLTGNANTNSGVNFLGTRDDNPLIIKTNNAESMRIISNGNVGIGNTTPGTKLEVGGGDIYVNNSANGVILKAPNGGCWRITVDNAGNLTTTSINCP